MIEVNERQWKQICEGISRGDLKVTQENQTHGPDCLRIYYEGDRMVACMCVHGSNGDGLAHELQRTFMATEDVLSKVSYIYIPTQEEADLWLSEDEDEEGNALYDWDAEIAKREPA